MRKQQTGELHGPGTGVSGGQFAAHAGGIGNVDADLDQAPDPHGDHLDAERFADLVADQLPHDLHLVPPHVRIGLQDKSLRGDARTLERPASIHEIITRHFAPLDQWRQDHPGEDPEHLDSAAMWARMGHPTLPVHMSHVGEPPILEFVPDPDGLDRTVLSATMRFPHHDHDHYDDRDAPTDPAECGACWVDNASSLLGDEHLREAYDNGDDEVVHLFTGDRVDAIHAQQVAAALDAQQQAIMFGDMAVWGLFDAVDREAVNPYFADEPQTVNEAAARRLLGVEEHKRACFVRKEVERHEKQASEDARFLAEHPAPTSPVPARTRTVTRDPYTGRQWKKPRTVEVPGAASWEEATRRLEKAHADVEKVRVDASSVEQMQQMRDQFADEVLNVRLDRMMSEAREALPRAEQQVRDAEHDRDRYLWLVRDRQIRNQRAGIDLADREADRLARLAAVEDPRARGWVWDVPRLMEVLGDMDRT